MARQTRDRLLFIRRTAELERVKRVGRRYQTPFFNLVSCPSSPDRQPCRVGIIVGKRLGPAVARNRAKRRFRELSRHVRPHLVSGRDMIVFPRREALIVSFEQLRATWLAALHHEGLMSPNADLSCVNSVSR